MRISTIVLSLLPLAGCAGIASTAPQTAGATTEGEVRALLDTIALDLARDGTVGWLPHFAPGDEFFMASDGRLAFTSFAHARTMCTEMADQFGSIDMRWSDVRVQPLAPGVATFGAAYSETLAQRAGGERHFEGFVTGVAVRATSRWRLQSLHWSSPPGPTQP